MIPAKPGTLEIGRSYKFDGLTRDKGVAKQGLLKESFTGRVVAEYPAFYLVRTPAGYYETVHKNAIGIDMQATVKGGKGKGKRK